MGEEPESLLVADFSHSRRLFRLIFTCECSLAHALRSGAGALHRIRSCGRGCPFSKSGGPM